MSNTPVSNKAAASASKSQSLAAQSLFSPALSSTQQFFSDSPAGKRLGSASGQRSSPAPRSNQNSKPKHKQGKKFKALDEDADAELYSMQNPHGRRGQQSITHLMQFALPPRPNAQDRFHRHSYNGPRRQQRHNPSWGMGSGYHAVDKARYIHANYRFIVDPRGDYSAQAADADVHLDWNNVLQIIASGKTQNASCPICLGEPTAPRMAKCGHIFCSSCLIRYMHSEDATNPPPEKRARWKKCPICWDSIYVSETRPVRWYDGQENDQPREGGDFVLRLVKRKPGSTLAMPRESGEVVAKGEAIPWYFAAEVMDYARVMKGSEDYMIQQYDEAIAAIEQMEKEDELMFGEDAEWTGRAIRMLKESKDKVAGIGNPPAQPQKPDPPAEPVPDRPPIEFNANDEGVPDMYLQKQNAAGPSATPGETAEASDAQPSSSPDVPRTLHEMRRRQFEKPQPNEYLFYHGLLHYYLSPLDIRILKTAFGTYNAFPSSILPRVERVSSGHVVDDDLRKRVKYLGHLPYGCEVGFLECDWRDVVSAQVLEEFRPMLERRRKRNDEKEAREEKDRIRIEKASERELAHLRQRRRPSITENDAFFSPALPVSIPEGVAIPGSPPFPNNAGRPGFTSLASPSTSPSVNRTVWGTSAVASSDADLQGLPTDDQFRQQEDGWLQGWEKDLLDGQEQQALSESMEGLNVNVKPAAGGKKGKKKQKITLMSTANARRGF
ncbi:putative RING finger protein P8B7.23 [Pseudocercospora fuligena]|uniref:Putative RING finger protein P8B7.23 n=1 Tax=Pseudocercospora fuligena TaxID=685502 RepID=A0A8H6RNK8_9PEZI|nr:putative RING finger protein P8B7.23 [Pseudocercospora fuligena]